MRDQTIYSKFPEFLEFKNRVLKPPLFLPASALAAGIWAGSAFQIDLALAWAALLLVCIGICVSCRSGSSGIFWIVFASFLAGCLHIQAFHTLPERHVKFLSDGKGALQGKVVSFPETVTKGKKRVTRFLIEAESWRFKKASNSVRGRVQVFIFYAPESIRYGDRLRIYGELKPPKRATNPKEFDYADYLEKQGIFKVLQAFGSGSVKRLASADSSWRARIENLRFLIQKRILALFPYPEREIIQALWLGFRRNIPDEINDVFIRTGTIHLFSISGLHVTLVGGFFYFLFRMLSVPRKLNVFLSISVILFYAVMAGGMPPVVRAASMGVFILGSILLEQDSESWYVLITAFLIILLVSPGSLFLLSFQLSFLSMAVLILFSRRIESDPIEAGRRFFQMSWIEKCRKWLIETIRTSCLIIVLLLPVFASYFHLSSLSGVLANTIAIPASLWVMILSLSSLFISVISWPLAVWIAGVACKLFSVLLFVLTKLASVWFLNWHLGSPPFLASLIYYAVLGFIYWHIRLKQAKPFLIALAVFAFLSAFSVCKPGAIFFDTGYSDCALLRFPRKRHLLINAARQLSDSRVNWSVEPSLLSSGTRKLWILLDQVKDDSVRRIVKNLAPHFFVSKFDPHEFPDMTLIRHKNGRLAAALAMIKGRRFLMIFKVNGHIIRTLQTYRSEMFDAVYIANLGKLDDEAVLIQFLADNGARNIIFNDRRFAMGFVDRLHGLGRSRLHFLSEAGAVSL